MDIFSGPEQMNTSAEITSEVILLISINSYQMAKHDKMKYQLKQWDLF